MNYDWDKLGVRMPPARKDIDMKQFEPGINWLKKHIQTLFGLTIKEAIYDDKLGWKLYDLDGKFVNALDFDTMERLCEVLQKIDFLEVASKLKLTPIEQDLIEAADVDSAVYRVDNIDKETP